MWMLRSGCWTKADKLVLTEKFFHHQVGSMIEWYPFVQNVFLYLFSSKLFWIRCLVCWESDGVWEVHFADRFGKAFGITPLGLVRVHDSPSGAIMNERFFRYLSRFLLLFSQNKCCRWTNLTDGRRDDALSPGERSTNLSQVQVKITDF